MLILIMLVLLSKTLSVPVVTLLAKDTQKLSKVLSKAYKGSVYWNEFEIKSDNKNTTNEYRHFPEYRNFVGVNRLFFGLFKQ